MPRKQGESRLDDRTRLLHMRDAAKEALEFTAGKCREDLNSDRLLCRGLVNCLQEIGEAASHVTDASRQRVPGVPWNQIVGMRHRLVHAYFSINPDLAWQVVEKDLHPLVTAIEAALDSWPGALVP